MKTNEFSFRSVNGKNDIHVIEWIPDGPVRAVLQLAHGVAEYSGRYDEIARFMAEHGIAVFGNDHLGHGKSAADETELGWFAEKNGWNFVVEDMKKLRDLQKEKYGNLPYFLLGHSMGSFLSRTYMIRYPNDFTGVILSGTAWYSGPYCSFGRAAARMEIRAHGAKYRSLRLHKLSFGSYLKHIEAPLGPNDWLTRDEDIVKKYTDDPLCGFVCTAGFMLDMLTGLDYIRRPENLEKMKKTTPVLFISGAQDPVGGWSKGFAHTVSAFKKAGMQDVTARLYDDGRHEILNELNRQEVYTDVLCWMEARL